MPEDSTTAIDQQRQTHEVFENLFLEYLKENRSKRRWSVILKLLVIIYLFALLLAFLYSGQNIQKPTTKSAHTAIINIKGVIASSSNSSADNIAQALKKAYENPHMQGIILKINSPGGSPVQAGQIYDEIIRQKKAHPDIKIYAVATDLCASAAYYIAAAADEIYADKASIVGSIGVLINSFGLVDAMEKLGIERRLLTAGENKGILDPFSPMNKQQENIIKEMLNNIHDQFVQSVKRGRGQKLAKDDKIFSGLIWTGEQALKLGLIDALGSPGHVAREIIGEEKIIDYTVKPNIWQELAKKVGAQTLQNLVTSLQMQFL